MATTYSDPSTTVVADRVLEAAGAHFARLQRLGIDLSPEPTPAGATIKVPVVKPGAAAAYDRETNNYATAQGAVELVDVALTSHPKITMAVTPEAAAKYGDKIQVVSDASVRASARAIGDAALTAWHGLLPAASATTSPAMTLASHTSGAAVDQGDVADILEKTLSGIAAAGGRPKLDGLEPGDCVLVLGAPAYAKLLSLYNVAAWDRDANPIRDGCFDGGLLGFRDVVCDPKIASSLIGYVVPFGSFALSGRPVEVRNPAAYAGYGYQADDRSGLTLTIRELLSGAVDDKLLTVEAQFGGTLALPGQVIVVKPHA